jgi:hypothetical protein
MLDFICLSLIQILSTDNYAYCLIYQECLLRSCQHASGFQPFDKHHVSIATGPDPKILLMSSADGEELPPSTAWNVARHILTKTRHHASNVTVHRTLSYASKIQIKPPQSCSYVNIYPNIKQVLGTAGKPTQSKTVWEDVPTDKRRSHAS